MVSRLGVSGCGQTHTQAGAEAANFYLKEEVSVTAVEVLLLIKSVVSRVVSKLALIHSL